MSLIDFAPPISSQSVDEEVRTQRRMKILHVILTLDPQDGGVPIVAYRLASAQAALGNEVHILCYTRPGADERMAIEFAQVPSTTSCTFTACAISTALR